MTFDMSGGKLKVKLLDEVRLDLKSGIFASRSAAPQPIVDAYFRANFRYVDLDTRNIADEIT